MSVLAHSVCCNAKKWCDNGESEFFGRKNAPKLDWNSLCEIFSATEKIDKHFVRRHLITSQINVQTGIEQFVDFNTSHLPMNGKLNPWCYRCIMNFLHDISS